MTKAQTKRTHTIVSVKWSRPYEDSPLECDCGWTGRAGDHTAHRVEVGARSNKAALSSHPHTNHTGESY